MKGEKFLICGTDAKMSECKNYLCEHGFDADCMIGDDFLYNLNSYKYIILPLPSIVDGVIPGINVVPGYLIEQLKDSQIVFYGNIEENIFDSRGFSYYYKDSFLDSNSDLTAQGVLEIIRNEVKDVFGSLKVCVVGYGRCGRAICRLLKKSQVETVLISRNHNSRKSAADIGCTTGDLTQLKQSVGDSDILINTVPVNIFTEECLQTMTRKNIYIEIASKPYGFDVEKADDYDFKFIYAKGLPGRFYPKKAGINIAEAVIEILKEGEYG